jgi:ABC-type spermidine/putrescine transport system permease subunit II
MVFYTILLFLVLPLVTMLVWSLVSPNGFEYLIRSGDYIVAIESAVFSLEIGLISVILSISLSRYLIKANIKHKVQLESLFYFPMLIPVVSVSIGSHKIFLGLGSQVSGLIIVLLHVYFSLPYAFKIVYACYSAWGVEYEQVGRELGASKLRVFFSINLPVYLKGYTSAFIMAFVVSYSQYFINYFIGDPRYVNFSMIMTPYISSSNRNISSVYTLVYVVLGIVVMGVLALIEKKFSVKDA